MSKGRLAAALGLVAGALALALVVPVAAQEPEPFKAWITGHPVAVGQFLEGKPEGAVTYRWQRCETGEPAGCNDIKGARSRKYKLVKKDLGTWIRVFVEPVPPVPPDPPDPTIPPVPVVPGAWSAPVGPVKPAPTPKPPPPAPNPQPAPSPDPDLGPPDVTPPAAQDPPAFSLAPRYLDPFPVVRIRGTITERGANVSLLRVTGPHRATVKIRCTGPHCPIKRRARRPGRIHALERFLHAGTQITIRVRRQARVGKYVRLTVRAGKAPARRDACVVPGKSRPVTCPPA